MVVLSSRLVSMVVSASSLVTPLIGPTIGTGLLKVPIREEIIEMIRDITLRLLSDNGYTVSECGQVLSLKGRQPRVLKQSIGSYGYRVVNLRIEGRSMLCLVHRLVATAYHRVIEDKPLVNHKDGNKLNNHKDNLEWVNHRENIQHAYDTGLISIDKLRKACSNSHTLRRHGE